MERSDVIGLNRRFRNHDINIFCSRIQNRKQFLIKINVYVSSLLDSMTFIRKNTLICIYSKALVLTFSINTKCLSWEAKIISILYNICFVFRVERIYYRSYKRNIYSKLSIDWLDLSNHTLRHTVIMQRWITFIYTYINITIESWRSFSL